MRKSELFAQILECVAFETEIAKEQILSKDKFQDVVDARYMLVHFCHKNGMYTTDIARMMRFSRRAIEKMVAGFDERKRYSTLYSKYSANLLRRSCLPSAPQ